MLPTLVAAALLADVYGAFVCGRVFAAEVRLSVPLDDLLDDLLDHRDRPVGLLDLPDLPGHWSDVGHPSRLNGPVRAGCPSNGPRAAGY